MRRVSVVRIAPQADGPPEPFSRAVVIVWYSREDYKTVLEVMDDAESLPKTYNEWLGGAEKRVVKLLRRVSR